MTVSCSAMIRSHSEATGELLFVDYTIWTRIKHFQTCCSKYPDLGIENVAQNRRRTGPSWQSLRTAGGERMVIHQDAKSSLLRSNEQHHHCQRSSGLQADAATLSGRVVNKHGQCHIRIGGAGDAHQTVIANAWPPQLPKVGEQCKQAAHPRALIRYLARRQRASRACEVSRRSTQLPRCRRASAPRLSAGGTSRSSTRCMHSLKRYSYADLDRSG